MITERIFGHLPSGEAVIAYDFISNSGYSATILSYGATLQSLLFPSGRDAVLGFDDLEEYLGPHPYFGAAIGRVANRISPASFQIDGIDYHLPKNEGENNLHTGPDGFDRVNWDGEVAGDTLILRHDSPDGHQGFPGNVHVEYSFRLDGAELTVEMRARTDKATPINLTYHPYFNFTDGGATDISDHWLWVEADHVLELDDHQVPTGALLPVAGTRFEFTDATINRAPGELDHCFALGRGDEPERDAPIVLMSSKTGDGVAVFTSYDGCQIYSGGGMPKIIGKNNTSYDRFHGVAIEPQHYPNSPNIPAFPSITLRPDESYSHYVRYRFIQG